MAAFFIGEIAGTEFRFVGRLGAALPERRAREVLARLRELEMPESPFHDHAQGKTRSTAVRWARPQLKAVISCLPRTRSGGLRHLTIKDIVEIAQAARTKTRVRKNR